MHFHWRFITSDPVGEFLPAAAKILTSYNTLCIEHADADDVVRDLYRRHISENSYWPRRDTISPHTNLFYCHLSSEFVQELLALAESREMSRILWHIRGYDRDRLIFYCHDACDGGEIMVSPRIPDEVIGQLADEAGCAAREGESRIDWDTVCAKRKNRN